MRALIQKQFGGTDVLEFVDRPEPEVGRGQVRVRVHAVSLNFGDKAMLLGLPKLFRPVFGRRRNVVVGRDLAGIVDAVGDDVDGFVPGDRVYGETDHGSCAELALVGEAELTKLPADMRMEDASTLPVAGTTALQAIRDQMAVQPGDKVLINGASGSVGTMAVQIAKAYGAHVTAVCSTRNLDQARALGADEVIDYTQQAYVDGGPRFDAILDLVGNHTLAERRSVLRPDGVYVASFGQGGSTWLGPLGRILAVAIRGLFDKRLKVFAATSNVAADLDELAERMRSGALKPVIEQVYPLEEAIDAFRVLVGGHARGKLVIRVGE